MISRVMSRLETRRAPHQPVVEQERRPHLVFSLARVEQALPLLAVREILQLEHLRPIPDAPQALMGVMNRRGECLPVIDLARLLGVGSCTQHAETCVLVVEDRSGARSGWLGLAVDAVRRILTLGADEVAPAPRLQAPFTIDFVAAMARAEGGFMPILDLAALLGSTALRAAAQSAREATEPMGVPARFDESSLGLHGQAP
jgi:purine-binding chemotaxis protein CheW